MAKLGIGTETASALLVAAGDNPQSTVTRPSVMERRRLVLSLTPTATRPCSCAAVNAPALAAVSMAVG